MTFDIILYDDCFHSLLLRHTVNVEYEKTVR